jgi:hypothetical protein
VRPAIATARPARRRVCFVRRRSVEGGGVCFDVQGLFLAVEDVIGAEVNQPDVLLAADPGQVGDGQAVDLKGGLGVAFGGVDGVVGGAVDNHVGLGVVDHPGDPVAIDDAAVFLGRGDASSVGFDQGLGEFSPQLPFGADNQVGCFHNKGVRLDI